MAFSTTVRGSFTVGGPGGITCTYGDWSGLSGDAAGTITVSGGYVIGSLFFSFDDDNFSQIFPRTSVSVSGSTTTITVQNQEGVTTGRFMVFHGGK